jgi:hypothetical protein
LRHRVARSALGMRVADASLMIGEKAADMVLRT